MNGTGMQHARQLDIGDPNLLGSDLGYNDAVLERLADDLVVADRLQRWIAFHGQAEDAGEIALDRNAELEVVIPHQLAIADLLAAAGDDTVQNGELVF